MATPSWTDSEPDYFVLRNELTRLRYRASRHRVAVLLCALGASLVAVLFTLRAPHKYKARVAVRVTETIDFALPRSNWTDRELKGYVNEVAFSDQVLLAVWEKYLRVPGKPVDAWRALSRFRDDLDVRVLRNQVAAFFEGVAAPRSAYVNIAFTAPTADQATAVVKALATPIKDVSSKRRRDEASQEIKRATLALEEARFRVTALHKEAMASAGSPLAGSSDISPVRMVGLEDAVAEAERRVARFQTEKQQAERRQRSEKSRPGINFEIAEESLEKPLPLLPVLMVAAVVTFLLSLPLAILVVGAFVPFVESVEDIRRLGLPALGHFPRART